MKRLLLMTDHYAPGRSSGARLMTELADGLRGCGIRVDVATTKAADRDHAASPDRVHEIPLVFGRTKRTWLRMLSELLFSLVAALGMVRSTRGCDHVLILASPPFLPLMAGPVAKLLRVPYSVILMDVYPDMAAHLGMLGRKGPVFRLWHAWLVAVLEQAAGVVVIGDCMKRHVDGKSSRIDSTVIPNWVRGEDVMPLDSRENPFLEEHPELVGRFVVQYAGNMGLAQDFGPLIEAAELSRDDDGIVFLMIGDGIRKPLLMREVEERKLGNVVFMPFLDPARQAEFLGAASVALVVLEPGVEGLAVPSKFYPIVAAGRPVIAMLDPDSEVGRSIRDDDLGVVLEQRSGRALYEAVLEIRKRGAGDKERIRRVFLDRFDAGHAVRRYADYLAGVEGANR